MKAVEPDRFALIVDFLAGFVPGGAEGCQNSDVVGGEVGTEAHGVVQGVMPAVFFQINGVLRCYGDAFFFQEGFLSVGKCKGGGT